MYTKHLGPLSKDEVTTLECMYQSHQKRRCQQRAHMVLLSGQGYCQREIARVVRVSALTVARYLKCYQESGFLGLYDAPIPGRPSKRPDAETGGSFSADIC